MAGLANYTDLLAAIASFSKRGDTGPLAPIWIALVETTLNRELTSYQEVKLLPMAISAEMTPLPADLSQTRSLRLLDSPYTDIGLLTEEQMNKRRQYQISGSPDVAAIIGGQLCINPVPAQTWNVELAYYANIPPLTAANPTNWVMTQAPDLYLWGCLTQAANYYEDDDQLQKFSALFKDALTGTAQQSMKIEAGFNLKPQPGSFISDGYRR
jgi:hypothetical protein